VPVWRQQFRKGGCPLLRTGTIVQHLILLALAAIVPFAGLIALNIYMQAQDDLENAEANVLQLAQSAAFDMDRLLRRGESTLKSLATRPLIRALDANNCDPILAEYSWVFAQATNLLTVDVDGRSVCAAIPPAPGGPQSVDPKLYLDAVKRTRTLVLGQPNQGFITRKWVVSLALPILDANGEVRGAAVLPFDLVKLSQTRNDSGLPRDAVSTIIDKSGMIISRSQDPEKWIGQRNDPLFTLSRSLTGNNRIGRTRGIDGIERIFAYQAIPGSDWEAVVGIPVAYLYAATKRNATINITIAICTMLLVALLCLGLARRIVRPVKAIAEGAMRVADGIADVRVDPEGPAEIVNVAREFNNMIALRGRTDAELRDLNRTLTLLSHCGQALVRANSEQQLLDDMCSLLVKEGGYALAWIGFAEDDDLRRVRPAAMAGATAYLDDIDVSWAENESGHGPTGTAVRTGQAVSITDTLTDSGLERWRTKAQQAQFRSSIALPIGSGVPAMGALSIYSTLPDRFNEQELKLLGELANDITYGIQSLRAEQALRKSEGEFRALAEAMPQIVWITRSDGWTIYFNQQWVTYTGLTLEESLGHGWIKPFHPDDQQDAWAAWQSATTQVGPYSIQSRLRRADGAYRWWLMRGVPLRDADGSILKWFGTCTDIHDLKVAEDRFRATFEQAAVGIVHTALDHRYLAINQKFCDILGYTRDELMQLDSVAITHPDDHNLDKDRRDQLLAGKIATYTAEKRFVRKDGSVIWTNRTISLARDEAGQPLYFIRVIEDITERKDAEERFRATFEQSAIGIAHTALDGRYLMVNERLCAMLGYAKEELLTKNATDITHPEDRAAGEARVEGLLANERISTYAEKRYIRKDGSAVWVGRSMSLIRDAEGKPKYLIAMVTDISARKQAEETARRERALLRAVVDAIPERIYVKDREGRFLLQNATNLAVRGITNHDEIVGKTVFDIFPRELAQRLHTEDEKAMESGVPVHDREGQTFFGAPSVLNKNTHWHLTSKIPLRDETGQVYGLVGVNRDITHRKQAEEALRQLNEELEDKVAERTKDLERARREADEANRAKSAFLATMSHEIRTPMNGVIGMIDVLQQTSLKVDQVEMVELIHDSAFSLLGIINDILDFSKIEAGKMEIENEALAVADVVEGVGNLLSGMAEKSDVVLTLFVDPAIPAQVRGDSLRLRQVLTNLGNNAIKFSSGQAQAGHVSLRALLVKQTPQQVTVEIHVTDNGIGMDEETQSRLFTAFTQADASTTRRFGGTGLGLAIVNHLVKLMGGEISVQSTRGAGATFKVRLPFSPLPVASELVEPTSDVAGLRCVVVGVPGGLADDLATYLVHAQAQVTRAPNVATVPDVNGLAVWVIDASNDSHTPEQMRAAARERVDQDVRMVVLIERGKRRRPRVLSPGLFTVDSSCLGRRTFLKLVAVAAGRASLDAAIDNTPDAGTAAVLLTRDEAVRCGRLILVAEDNATNQKVIARQLGLLGYTADVAADGREALRRWRSGDYALLLTDLHMPQLDGYELTQAIRAEEKPGTRMPIIALTANALKGEADHCRALGMDDYRSKPLPLADLKLVLEQWLPVAHASAVISDPLTNHARDDGPPSVATPPVDVGALKALVGDDPELVHEFLQDFRSSAARIAQDLRAACAARQAKAAADAAHKLKSSAGAVGAYALSDLCAAMEEKGRADDPDALTALLPRFDLEMARVDDCLKTG
jgi:PAS domain S-box-containing protein